MKLAIQFFFLVSILLFGAFVGIDTAEKGIHQVDGNAGHQPQTFHITRVDDGKIEINVLGKRIVTDKEGNVISPAQTAKVEPTDKVLPTDKEDTIVERKGEVKTTPVQPERNWLSDIGSTLGFWVHRGTRVGIEWLVERLS